jgi:hypothetical protein
MPTQQSHSFASRTSNTQAKASQRTNLPRPKKGQLVTRFWQKWRFSAPQTHLW